MAKKVFSLTLMDDTCDIKATFWDEVADRYFDVLETGKSYTFHKGSFKMANQRYNSTKCEYEVTFNNDSIVEICRDVDAPQVRFSFVAIDKLQTMIGKNVDVVGVVTEVQELGEITIKQGRDAGKQKAKRNVSIADNSGMQISLTLWDSNAEAIDASAASDKAVLAVRAVRVSDYGGCSINTTRGSIMQLNPELPEAAALREWYDSKGGAPALTSVGGGAGAGAGGAGPAPRKYMSDIESEALGMKEKPDYFSVRATLMYVNHEKTWQYPSNPENKRKVTEEGGAWRDEKTGQIIDKCERRYIVPVSFTDLTGRHFLTVFDDDAKKIFGQTADDLFELQQQDEAAFQQVFKDAFFKEYVLKVRAKAETYQDQTRVKCSVVAADHVNFRSEGKLLLDTIRKYGL
jgi:replication factor A1